MMGKNKIVCVLKNKHVRLNSSFDYLDLKTTVSSSSLTEKTEKERTLQLLKGLVASSDRTEVKKDKLQSPVEGTYGTRGYLDPLVRDKAEEVTVDKKVKDEEVEAEPIDRETRFKLPVGSSINKYADQAKDKVGSLIDKAKNKFGGGSSGGNKEEEEEEKEEREAERLLRDLLLLVQLED